MANTNFSTTPSNLTNKLNRDDNYSNNNETVFTNDNYNENTIHKVLVFYFDNLQ